jgi:hypothetical protein
VRDYGGFRLDVLVERGTVSSGEMASGRQRLCRSSYKFTVLTCLLRVMADCTVSTWPVGGFHGTS